MLTKEPNQQVHKPLKLNPKEKLKVTFTEKIASFMEEFEPFIKKSDLKYVIRQDCNFQFNSQSIFYMEISINICFFET